MKPEKPEQTSAAAAAHWLKNPNPPARKEKTQAELLAEEPEWKGTLDDALRNAGLK